MSPSANGRRVLRPSSVLIGMRDSFTDGKLDRIKLAKKLSCDPDDEQVMEMIVFFETTMDTVLTALNEKTKAMGE